MQKIKIEQHGNAFGLWCAAWLFTIGFLKLALGKAILAIILWPYFLGAVLSNFLH